MIGNRARSPAAPRIAIVTPWFGPDLRGGAEQQSWQLANQLTASGNAVDVLATCSAGFNESWSKNRIRPGTQRRGLLTIRRFRVAKRDWRAFERVNAILTSLGPADLRRGVSPISEADARLFYEHNINSPALYAHLVAEGQSYSHVLFLPYLYGPTLFGLPLVADRAYLQPCLHNEAYAYLPRVAETVHAAKGILLNSDGEYELALRLFGPGIAKKSVVVGEGIDVLGDPAKFSEQIGSFIPSRERFVLYLGRQSPEKNVPMLVSAYGEFRRRQPASSMRLVLAGERSVSYGDPAKGIIDLGPVSEAEKAALLRHALALVQPSTNESFSRVIYESWVHGRPAVVHRECMPTATAVARSGGGFTADSTPAWVDALEQVDFSSREELERLGRLGHAYAENVSSWPEVVSRYESIFKDDGSRPANARQAASSVVQAIAYDAQTAARTYASALAAALSRGGIEVVEQPVARAMLQALPVILHERASAAEPASPAAAVVYHADGPSDPQSPATLEPSSNGTPAELGGGVFASSPATLRELRRRGIRKAQFLPVCVDPREWDEMPDVPLMAALQDVKRNILYVGPIVSLKCLNELLIVFLNFLALERESRLTIVCNGPIDEEVYAQLFDELRRLELEDRVLVARELSSQQLQAAFRVADVFLSLEESEGLGQELLQAMWFDVPVVAYRTSIARELVGSAGLLLNDKNDLLAVAALLQIVTTDESLRATVIAGQRLARERFDASKTTETILAALLGQREASGRAEAGTTWRS